MSGHVGGEGEPLYLESFAKENEPFGLLVIGFLFMAISMPVESFIGKGYTAPIVKESGHH